jgi:hypothetical protein
MNNMIITQHYITFISIVTNIKMYVSSYCVYHITGQSNTVINIEINLIQ